MKPIVNGGETGETLSKHRNLRDSPQSIYPQVTSQKDDEVQRIDVRILLDLVKAENGDGNEGARQLERVFRKLSKTFEYEDSSTGVRTFLSGIIEKMKRQNKWRIFSNVGRGILTLCTRLSIRFRGMRFLHSLAVTLKEASLLLNPLFKCWLGGVDVAHRMSRAAYRWGYKEAISWRYEDNFIIFLGITRSSAPHIP